MFFENKLKTKATQSKHFRLKKFDDLALKNSENISTDICYNFNVKNNKLTGCLVLGMLFCQLAKVQQQQGRLMLVQRKK